MNWMVILSIPAQNWLSSQVCVRGVITVIPLTNLNKDLLNKAIGLIPHHDVVIELAVIRVSYKLRDLIIGAF